MQPESFGLSKKRFFVLDEAAGVCAYYAKETCTDEEMKGASELQYPGTGYPVG